MSSIYPICTKKRPTIFYHEAALLNPSVRIEIVKKSFQENKQALGQFHLDEAKKWQEGRILK
jgi:hypothetical protein